MKHQSPLRQSLRSPSGFFLIGLILVSFGASGSNNLLDPATQPRFVNRLTVPQILDARSGGTYTVPVTQFQQDLGLKNPGTHDSMLTTVWGYGGMSPGPTIITQKGTPADFYFHNELRNGTTPLPHLLEIDATIHWAFSGDTTLIRQYGVPISTHLHGGKTESAYDGLPDSWYTPGYGLPNPECALSPTVPYHYANDQEAATNWYHDHTLGITRLNVYTGLYGAYLLRDDTEDQLIASNQLPSDSFQIPLILQDRMFTDNGQLYYPSENEIVPGIPSVLPEFYGNIMLVNDKAWPYLEVEPRPYRFRLINASDSRFYHLFFHQSVMFKQIGADMGLLPAVNTTRDLLIAPGERIDVVIDFGAPALAGKTLVLRNDARYPYPYGDRVDANTDGMIMAFKVTLPLNTRIPKAVLPTTLRAPITPYVQNGPTRKLLLFEGEDDFGRLMPMLGTADDGKMMWMDPVTETPTKCETELWEVYNNTEDAHPVHLHGTAFQIVDRQRFTADPDETTGALRNIRTFGVRRTPGPSERGWKDTAPSYPGEVLRLLVKFELPGKYVWHCHILSHEDNEMMRPIVVQDAPNCRIRQTGLNPGQLSLGQNVPNPFGEYTQINFKVPVSGPTTLQVFDMAGKLVDTLVDADMEAGDYDVEVKSSEWQPGLYMYVLSSNGASTSRTMVRH